MATTHSFFHHRVEFTTSWGLALEYCRFEEHDSLHIHLGWGKCFIRLPWGPGPIDCMLDRWGFSVHERAIHLHWRDKTKVVNFPWDWKHVRCTVWDSSGRERSEEVENIYGTQRLDLLEAPGAGYTYMLRSGEKQHRMARYYVEEREWRWRWFTRLPWPRRINKCISVDFNEEVGEGTGSWRGGVTGCGYDMHPGESALGCLRRMERERKFDR